MVEIKQEVRSNKPNFSSFLTILVVVILLSFFLSNLVHTGSVTGYATASSGGTTFFQKLLLFFGFRGSSDIELTDAILNKEPVQCCNCVLGNSIRESYSVGVSNCVGYDTCEECMQEKYGGFYNACYEVGGDYSLSSCS